jgi:hypothetical protein
MSLEISSRDWCLSLFSSNFASVVIFCEARSPPSVAGSSSNCRCHRPWLERSRLYLQVIFLNWSHFILNKIVPYYYSEICNHSYYSLYYASRFDFIFDWNPFRFLCYLMYLVWADCLRDSYARTQQRRSLYSMDSCIWHLLLFSHKLSPLTFK